MAAIAKRAAGFFLINFKVLRADRSSWRSSVLANNFAAVKYGSGFRNNQITKAPIPKVTSAKIYGPTNFGSPREVTRFIQFMNYLDTTRNTDWKNKFPEVWSLVEKYNPTDVTAINNPGSGGHMQ